VYYMYARQALQAFRRNSMHGMIGHSATAQSIQQLHLQLGYKLAAMIIVSCHYFVNHAHNSLTSFPPSPTSKHPFIIPYSPHSCYPR
jgi:hypothetical protein